MDEIMKKAESKMDKTIAGLQDEYACVRAGRANPAVLEKIHVDYYGVPTAINQMAAVSVSEARILQIQPWDISTLHMIEKAIQISDLGINPQNDGRIIRLVFPPLTEERRKELVKDLTKYAEEAKVAFRTARRDAIEKYKAQKKNGEITEDDLKESEKDIQKLTDKFCKQADELCAKKEKEIMEI
ncbi:MAG TPA: ribosome recycling factor [Ruminococcaceae bacterium]|nr:ribosome recycling factor [Oscillospiraceae bacterium]